MDQAITVALEGGPNIMFLLRVKPSHRFRTTGGQGRKEVVFLLLQGLSSLTIKMRKSL